MSYSARKKSIAVLFSFFVPGLGHAYSGYFSIGLIISLIFLLLPFYALRNGALESFKGLIIYYLIYLVLYAAVVVNSARAARMQRKYIPRAYNRPSVYVLWIALFWFIAQSSYDNNFQTYKVSSLSMMPAINKDDYIFCDKDYYSSNPIKRGDIVVFDHHDKDGVVWTKRVIALGGDRIRIDRGRVFLNGQIINEPYVDEDNARLRYSRYFKEVTVPDDMLFLMGDYRDESEDSRHLGPFPREDILGRVLYVLLSLNNGTTGDKL